MARIGNLDYDDARKSDVIPEGEYEAQIVDSSIAATKDGSGKILALVFEVTVDGRKRRHWERLNVQNKNADAQRIATRQLLAIMDAVNVPAPLIDSDDLHHKPMLVKVAIKDEGDYGLKNRLTKVSPWRATGGRPLAPAAATASPARTAAPAKGAAGSAMPWDD
jgi:hypothetical protein